jgi:hypothetical protein
MVQTWWPVIGVFRTSSDLSDLSQVLRPVDILRLLKISTGYSKYFVHALHDVPHDTRLFLAL